MKSKVVVFRAQTLALLYACIWMAACGAGPDNPPAPIVSVLKTRNPLVANVTVLAPCEGQTMVEFGTDTNYGRSTALYPTNGAYRPVPILVAGMKASTTYHMRAQVQCAGSTSASGDQTFTTGALPSIGFPTFTVTRPSPSLSSTENPGIENIDVPTPSTPAFFTDRDGNVIWYYNVGAGNYAFPFKLLANGHVLVNVVSPTGSALTEIDLSGKIIRSLDIYTLQRKLADAGFDFEPAGFHHDFLELPNGHIIALTNIFKNFTNLPGYPGTTEVQGDAVVDLDENLNPVWGWNSFDYLDINRHLNGLPDWTHSNALVYSPGDGNLLLSMRHQSWVLKIDYNNGSGTGNILWHLGYQGDFALTNDGVPTDDPSEWFSFQHYPALISQNGSQSTIAIWDNGDDRPLSTTTSEVCSFGGAGGYPACYSRPSIFQVDEASMVANIAWADPLSYFGIWGGSINQLQNGNVEYDLNDPITPPSPNVASEVQEVTQTAVPQVVWQMDITPITKNAYRAYRVPSLYNGVVWP